MSQSMLVLAPLRRPVLGYLFMTHSPVTALIAQLLLIQAAVLLPAAHFCLPSLAHFCLPSLALLLAWKYMEVASGREDDFESFRLSRSIMLFVVTICSPIVMGAEWHHLRGGKLLLAFSRCDIVDK